MSIKNIISKLLSGSQPDADERAELERFDPEKLLSEISDLRARAEAGERSVTDGDEVGVLTRHLSRLVSLVVNEDLKFLMPSVTADVLLIWGENDDATPVSDGYTMEKLMQKAGLAVVKGAGHYPFLDQPKVFFGIMDAVM